MTFAVTPFVFMIPLALLFLVFIVWKLSEMIIYTLMVTYDLKTKDLIRNAILLTVGNLPLAVGVKLLTLVFPIIAFVLLFFIPSIELPVIMVFCLLYLIYIPAFNRLITCSYSNALCEKYLNSKIGAPTKAVRMPSGISPAVASRAMSSTMIRNEAPNRAAAGISRR